MKKKAMQITSKVMTGMMAFALMAGTWQPMTAKAAPDYYSMPKFDSAPVIDGKIDADEWGEAAFTVKLGEDNVNLADGVDSNEFSADVYFGYDSTHIYIGVEATYPNHENTESPEDMWKNDCIQLQIADKSDNGHRNELGFALNSETNEPMTTAWASYAKDGYNMEAGTDYTVVRDGDVTTYEIALGVEQFTRDLAELEDGSSVKLSMLFHTGGLQGDGNSSVIEWSKGIWVDGKDITVAPEFFLGEKPKGYVMEKYDTAPTLDGKIDGDEWGEAAFTVKLGEKNVTLADGVDSNEFSADVYLGYDSDHIYIGIAAQYPNHENTESPEDMWKNDCIQLQIADKSDNGHRNELGFALNSETNEPMTTAWASYAKDGYNMEAGTDYTVARDGDVTTYEIALGVDQFSKDLTALEEGMGIKFSLLFHTGGLQGEGNSSVIEWSKGIWVDGKDVTAAPLFGLGVEVEEEVPAAPTEEPTEEPSDEAPAEEPSDEAPAEEPSDEASAEEPSDEASAATDAPAEESGSNTVVIVVVVIVVIAVIAAVVVVMKKKKDSDSSAK